MILSLIVFNSAAISTVTIETCTVRKSGLVSFMWFLVGSIATAGAADTLAKVVGQD